MQQVATRRTDLVQDLLGHRALKQQMQKHVQHMQQHMQKAASLAIKDLVQDQLGFRALRAHYERCQLRLRESCHLWHANARSATCTDGGLGI